MNPDQQDQHLETVKAAIERIFHLGEKALGKTRLMAQSLLLLQKPWEKKTLKRGKRKSYATLSLPKATA